MEISAIPITSAFTEAYNKTPTSEILLYLDKLITIKV